MSAMEGAPNQPKTFGDELKRLRESAGLTVEDIAAETKISKRILCNLEDGEFRFLPQKVFSRNFVSQYAAVVGADPYHLTESFEAAWDRFLLASGAHPRLADDEEPFVRTVRWRFWLPVAIAAVILLAAVLVIVRGSTYERSLAPTSRVQTPVALAPSPTARRVVPSPASTVDPPIVSEDEVVLVVITVQPDMECWIHYRNRDGVAGGKLLAGGTVERLELAAPAKLTVGDASAVTLEVGGQTYQDFGRPGQVVHTEIESSGLTVLGPRARNE